MPHSSGLPQVRSLCLLWLDSALPSVYPIHIGHLSTRDYPWHLGWCHLLRIRTSCLSPLSIEKALSLTPTSTLAPMWRNTTGPTIIKPLVVYWPRNALLLVWNTDLLARITYIMFCAQINLRRWQQPSVMHIFFWQLTCSPQVTCRLFQSLSLKASGG